LAGSTVITTSLAGLLPPTTMLPPFHDVLFDPPDNVVHLAPENRFVEYLRPEEPLDQALEPEAERHHACDLGDDLELAPKPRPGDASRPGATKALLHRRTTPRD